MTTAFLKEGEWGVRLVADTERLLEVRLTSRGPRTVFPSSHPVLGKMEGMLRRYFKKGEPLEGVPLSWSGQSLFQQKVLGKVRLIPFGETRSYGWLAREIGVPGGARACGQALRRNRFPLLIPCHRVVAGSGLGGFSCGVCLKEKLLIHERAFSKGSR